MGRVPTLPPTYANGSFAGVNHPLKLEIRGRLTAISRHATDCRSDQLSFPIAYTMWRRFLPGKGGSTCVLDVSFGVFRRCCSL